jgi:malonyl CoA-acyl carrier protein transacylase
MRVAFLYPGQGTRRPGMLHDLPGHPAVAATLAEAADLARSIATTVRWRDAVALLGELGTTLFIQAPPGHVLARMAAAAHPMPVSSPSPRAASPTRHCAPAVRTIEEGLYESIDAAAGRDRLSGITPGRV